MSYLVSCKNSSYIIFRLKLLNKQQIKVNIKVISLVSLYLQNFKTNVLQIGTAN